MNSSYSAWADGLNYTHAYHLEGSSATNSRLPSADPTDAQPFTTSKNVSYLSSMPLPMPMPLSGTLDQDHPPNPDMARKRQRLPHPHQAVPSSNAAHGATHGTAQAHAGQDFACPAAAVEHCHFSPPCDKPDCDEATICFDHNAHDFFPCNNDLSWCRENLACDDVFACGDACDFDFDCSGFPCPETCHESECHIPQHAQDCNTACATVACSDPQCNEGVLYCCLSDICPHKTHSDCQPPCAQDCSQPHAHHIAPPAVACHQPCNNGTDTLCALSVQDSLSASTISTPHTDLSESLHTPTSLQFQTLVEAAATQALLNNSEGNEWGFSSNTDRYVLPSQCTGDIS